MLSVTLGNKAYEVPFVSAKALREIDRPAAILQSADTAPDPAAWRQDLDVLVGWFCLLFGNQFSADDVWRYYPADRLLHDISLAVLAVQQHVSQALHAFPTTPAAEDKAPADK